MANKPDLHLYTTQTPNGVKISITLEELGLPYETTTIEFSKNTQKEPWFMKINPNGRIPALTDTFSDGNTINVFESGAIQLYLVEKYDTEYKISYPKGTREYYNMMSWLFFVNAGVGPMQGQSNHFTRYAPEKIEYGMTRYQNETRRLYQTLDDQLKANSSPYIVGEKCTIVDISLWGWVTASFFAGVDLSEFPLLDAWEERMANRPGVQKGKDVPSPHKMREMRKDPNFLEKEASKNKEWVQQGNKNLIK